jgi:hypothetical protein
MQAKERQAILIAQYIKKVIQKPPKEEMEKEF